MQGINMEELYGVFADGILRDKGINVTPEQREALLLHIDEAVDAAMLEALPLEQLDKLEAAVKNDAVEENTIDKLLSESGLDAKVIIDEALDDYRKKFLEENK